MKVVARIFFVLQILAELVLAYALWRTGMLTLKLWIPAGAIFAALAVITAALAFPGGTGSKVVSVLLAIVFSAICAYGARAALKAVETIDTITATKEFSTVVGVYVKSDDAAETIQDAALYTYAISMYAEGSSLQKSIDLIAADIGTDPSVCQYTSSLDAASAFMDGLTDAVILEEGYADILSDLDDYSSFGTDSKLIAEYTITETVSADGAEDDTMEEDAQPAEVTSEPFIVYVSGSDTRSTTLTKSRSDVNILMAVNPNTGDITLINTPRDYYVPISVSSSGACDKLTHCGIYGIDCSMDTLGNLYDVDVDYYLQLNFTGFKTLIDAIGGIDIYSDVAFTTSPDAYYISAGENHMDGATALAFVRERHALAGGDNTRGENQMKMIKAVIAKVTDAPTLLTSYSSILDSLSGMLATNLSSQQISDLVKLQIDNSIQWNITSYSVTGSGGSSTTYSVPSASAYVTYPDYDTVTEASNMLKAALGE